MFPSSYFAPVYFAPRYFPRPTGAPAPSYTSLEQSLVAELRGATTLVALLGTYQGSPRIFADDRPQGATLPAVVYATSGTDRTAHLDGRGRVADARVSIEIHGKSRAEVRAIADLVIPLLCDKATPSRLGGSGVEVLEILLDDESSGYVQAGDGTDQPFRWIVLEYAIRFREAV